MIDGKTVAVVVPAHNEQKLIGEVLRSMPSFVDRIIVVDDASDDETSKVVRSYPDDRVMLIRHEKNAGVGAAIATGYEESLKHAYSVTAVMAGDNQMDPRDLEGLVRPILQGLADYTKGDRLHHPVVRATMPRQRRLASIVLSRLTALAVRIPQLSDSQCGYTAISHRALMGIEPAKMWKGFGYPNDLLGRLIGHGYRSMDVEVRPVYANETSELRIRHVFVIVGLIARAAYRVRTGDWK
jgi:glycosyltransferase involved in cell wall biosynthesis